MSSEKETNPAPLPRRKQDWKLSAEAFDRLLSHLAPDRDRAGELYEELRQALTTFFDWRGCAFSEELADETLNRAARRLEEGEEIRNLQDYCRGVARRLALETLPKQRKLEESPENFKNLPSPSANLEEELDRDRRYECFEQCLNRLSSADRELVINYYKTEKRAKIDHRIELAAALGVNLNRLRVKVFRLRAKLEECINRCLNQNNQH